MRQFLLSCALLCALTNSASAGPLKTDVLALRPLSPGSITCPSGLACVAASSVSGKPYLVDSLGNGWPAEETQAFLRKATAPGTPSDGSVYYNSSLGLFQFYSGAWFSPVSQGDFDAAERPFTRTCALTSAAASVPITCLDDADVPAGKRAYPSHWFASVNGTTAWSTTATVAIKDSSGLAVPFVTMAVAALTGNAFVSDHSANVTQGTAYKLGQGTSLACGLVLVGNANGTGSTVYVTVSGTIR